MTAVKPFEQCVVFAGEGDEKTVTFIDASGSHEVPVRPQFEEKPVTTLFEADSDGDYIVYAKLPVSDPPSGCIVVPEDSIVTAIHYRVFGPAPKADCDKFELENCGPRQGLAAMGGEIPWPLAN